MDFASECGRAAGREVLRRRRRKGRRQLTVTSPRSRRLDRRWLRWFRRAATRAPPAGGTRAPAPDYLAIQNGGRRVGGTQSDGLFALAGSGRLGITVSRKVGGAVVRNRVKRWIRECYRRGRRAFPGQVDFVVVARPAAADAGHGGHLPRAGRAGAAPRSEVGDGVDMSWVLLVLVRVYRVLLSPVSPRAVRAVLPVRADLLGLRRGGDPDARRAAGRLAGRAPPAALSPVRARGLRSGAAGRCCTSAARESKNMEKRVILAIGLCVGVLLIWTSFFPPPKPTPPAATAPVAGADHAGACARGAAADAAPGAAADAAGAAAARPAGHEPARAAGRAPDARRPLRLLQPGRDPGARAAARASSSSTTQGRSGQRPRPRAHDRRRRRPAADRVPEQGIPDAAPTAPGRRASRPPTP